MVKMINKLTKTVMYVNEKKADEYVKAGHTLVEKPKKKKTTKKKVS